MKKLTKNVFTHTASDGANIGCVAGDDAIVLIDLPQDPLEASAWRKDLAAELGPKHIRAILFTSSDRLNSEAIAAVNAPTVLHDAAYAQLSTPEESPMMQMLEPMALPPIRELGATPQVTFSNSASIVLGGKQPHFVDVIHYGGYTPDACIVIPRGTGIAFVGDLVAVGQPPLLAQGNFEQWQAVLAALKKNKTITTLVPGRGPVGVPATATDDTTDYIKTAVTRVKALVRANRNRGDVAGLVPDLMSIYGPKGAKGTRHSSNMDAVSRYVRAGLERIYDDLKSGAAV